MTEMSCLNFLSRTISSSSSRTSPSTFTRVKPSARSSSNCLPYSPLRPRTIGAMTMNRVPVLQRHDLVDDLLGRLGGDRPPAVEAVRLADPRPQQAQVVVDLGDRADRRARVARRRLLVDRDRRRQALDRVHVGLVHLPQELPRVRAERLDITPLALGVDRVERERRLAGARQAGDDHQRVARHRHGDVLEVVLARAGDDDLVLSAHHEQSSGGRDGIGRTPFPSSRTLRQIPLGSAATCPGGAPMIRLAPWRLDGARAAERRAADASSGRRAGAARRRARAAVGRGARRRAARAAPRAARPPPVDPGLDVVFTPRRRLVRRLRAPRLARAGRTAAAAP